MESENKTIIDAWIAAIGTIVSAIGSTPSARLGDNLQSDFGLIGNVLQATGNALQVDEPKFDNIGNQIQAIGNITVILGLVSTDNKKKKQTLIIKGNLLQALGASIQFSDFTQTEGPIINIGNLLEAIGNSMQAIGAKDTRTEIDSETLNVAGNWIQAAGAVVVAVSLAIKNNVSHTKKRSRWPRSFL